MLQEQSKLEKWAHTKKWIAAALIAICIALIGLAGCKNSLPTYQDNYDSDSVTKKAVDSVTNQKIDTFYIDTSKDNLCGLKLITGHHVKN